MSYGYDNTKTLGVAKLVRVISTCQCAINPSLIQVLLLSRPLKEYGAY